MNLINYMKFTQTSKKYKNIEDSSTFKVCDSFEDYYNQSNGCPTTGEIILIHDQLYLYRGRNHATGNLSFTKLKRSDSYDISDVYTER